MKQWFTIILYLFSVLSASFTKPEIQSQELSRVVVPQVKEFRRKTHIPGIALGIYYKGKPYFYNFGFADEERRSPVTRKTIFEIGSITKSFTALLLALEVQRGHMKLNDPLVRYMPFLQRFPGLFHAITLKHLATHTAGLSRTPSTAWPRRGKKKLIRPVVIRSLLRWQPRFFPGTDFLYSNWGFALLGFALENRTGKPYGKLLQEEILRPLGMTSTFLQVPLFLRNRYAQGYRRNRFPAQRWPLNGMNAGGGLRSTTADLMKFLMANLGLYGPQELIKAMQLTHRGFFRAGPYRVQALSWSRNTKEGYTIIAKNGGVTGFSSYMAFIPEKEIGLILLSNKRCSHVTPFGRSLLVSIVSQQSKKIH